MLECVCAWYFVYLLVYMRTKWHNGLAPFSFCVCSISTRWNPWGLPSMPHRYQRWRQAALLHLWSAQQDWRSDPSLRSHLGQAALMVTLRVREKDGTKKVLKASKCSTRLAANVLLEFKLHTVLLHSAAKEESTQYHHNNISFNYIFMVCVIEIKWYRIKWTKNRITIKTELNCTGRKVEKYRQKI